MRRSCAVGCWSAACGSGAVDPRSRRSSRPSAPPSRRRSRWLPGDTWRRADDPAGVRRPPSPRRPQRRCSTRCPTARRRRWTSATGTVELNFWHGMQGRLGDSLQRSWPIEYNASQTKVRVTLVPGQLRAAPSTSTCRPSQDNRPDLVQMPEYMVQTMVDSDSVVPVEACIECDQLRHQPVPAHRARRLRHRGRAVGDAVQHLQPGAVYNKKMFAAAGLDPDKPPVSLDELRADSAADRPVRRRQVRARPRHRVRLRWRLVHRAVVRQGRRVLRRQPERSVGAGNARCCTTRPPGCRC